MLWVGKSAPIYNGFLIIKIILSESGCPGFEDVQDVVDELFLGDESCVCLNQDIQDFRM